MKEFKPFGRKPKKCFFSLNNGLTRQTGGCQYEHLYLFFIRIMFIYYLLYLLLMFRRWKNLKTSILQMLCGWYVCQKKNEAGKLYKAFSSYHRNIKLILKLNPTKFLVTEIIRSNSKNSTIVYNKIKRAPCTFDNKNPNEIQMQCYYRRAALELRKLLLILILKLNVLLRNI